MSDKYTKKIVGFDFDGVINSYKSGWVAYDEIPDPPVEGIQELIKSIRAAGYKVVIFSSRCSYVGGIKAIADYLRKHDIVVDDIVKEKPPAHVILDDRAITFTGNTEGVLEQIKSFKAWYEKEKG